MKKLSKTFGLLLLSSTLTFAKSSIAEKEVEMKCYNDAITTSESNDSFCKVSCNAAIIDEEGNPKAFTATAGGLFVSCEKALERCKEKLDNMMYP